MYASMVEGYFRFSHMVAGFSSANLPELSEFHPYHPLTHILVSKFFWLTGGPGHSSALIVATCISKISSLAAIALAYLLFRKIQNQITSILLTACLFFSKSFLVASYTGEAHITSYAFFLASVILTIHAIKHDQNTNAHTAPSDWRDKYFIVGASILYVVGASFNLAIFFYGILQTALLIHKRRFDLLVIATSISGILLFSVYMLYPWFAFELTSFAELRAIYEIYPSLPGLPSPLGERAVDVWRGIGAGAVGGVDGWATGLRVALGALALGGALQGWRLRGRSAASPQPGQGGAQEQQGEPGLPFWVPLWVGGFWVGEIAMNTAKSVNGTLYVMLPLLVGVGFALRPLLDRTRARWLVIVAVATLGALNFERVVWRKIGLDEKAARPLRFAKSSPPPSTPVLVVIDHMSIFESIYTLGHDYGIKRIDSLIALAPGTARDSAQWRRDFPRSCILTSNRPRIIHGVLWFEHQAVLTPDEYHFSVVHADAERLVPKDTYLACQGVPRVARAVPEGG